MLYAFLKVLGRPAIRIYCKGIRVNQPEKLRMKGPLLLAANHPNSFLDAVILDLLFDEPIWSLARGDAFVNPSINRILYALHILPVYRASEGVENLSSNYKTFENCIALFREKGLVLMFSEGRCINEWHLRPLKKGTARLAIRCWEEGIPLRVLPVGINYDSFDRIGKSVHINFGKVMEAHHLENISGEGARYQAFNRLLENELEAGVYEFEKNDREGVRNKIRIQVPRWRKILLFLPALAGGLIHLPIYAPLHRWVSRKYAADGHHDSVMVGLLLIGYPFYILLWVFLALIAWPGYWIAGIPLLLPFSAWAYTQVR